jgi:hypothetical protein
MPIFTASRLSSDNTLFPDRLEIDASNVTYHKGYVLGHKTVVIARNNVASVSLSSGIIFADVIIESIGGKKITANGFKKSDAQTIVSLLTD